MGKHWFKQQIGYYLYQRKNHKMKTTLIVVALFSALLFSFNLQAQITPTYDDVMIPMSDMEELEADIYVPNGCTSCEAILVQTPYNKDLFEWSGLPMGIGADLDDQQFVWVIVDWRGFYGSSGADLSSVDRGQDAFDICDWIVDQSWHGERIGTWGPSALGNIQYQLIGKHHPNHTCAVPVVANPQFSYDSYFYGGVLEEARLEQLDVLGYGLSPVIMANVYYNTTWQYAESGSYFPNQIEIPTLQIGGWYDHNIDEMMQFYKLSRSQAEASVQDEQWLLVGPWVHGGTGIAFVGSATQGQLSYPNAELVNNDMAWDFLEYYLLDSANDWNYTPKITYYELGNNTWHTSNASDIAIANTEVLYLNSLNRLTTVIGNGSSAFLSDPTDPTPTIGGATLHPDLDQGPYDQTYLDGRDDIHTFETDPLTQPISVTGRITVKLYISATQPDCDVVIRLVDQYPDGTNMLITDGIKRMRFRDGAYTQADEEMMTPGEVYAVTVELPFTNYTWLAEHKIKIYVSGNSSIRWNINSQDGGPMYTSVTPNEATITVHHDATYKSKMMLPGDNPFLGVDDNETTSFFELYPNPATENLIIKTDATFTSYQVSDMSGRLVASGNVVQNSIPVANLECGIYLLSLIDHEGNIAEKKFVKQ
jgi:predicted acyl esterase